MANISIPITDHNADGVCTQQYLVKWRLDSSPEYIGSDTQYESPIVLNNLTDGATYVIEITRQCCDGSTSTTASVTFDTTALEAPEGFTATQDGADVDLDWDDYVGAANYEWQRADDINFTTGLTSPVVSAVSNATDTSVPVGTYWYRVRALIGDIYTDYATDSVTVS